MYNASICFDIFYQYYLVAGENCPTANHRLIHVVPDPQIYVVFFRVFVVVCSYLVACLSLSRTNFHVIVSRCLIILLRNYKIRMDDDIIADDVSLELDFYPDPYPSAPSAHMELNVEDVENDGANALKLAQEAG